MIIATVKVASTDLPAMCYFHAADHDTLQWNISTMAGITYSQSAVIENKNKET
jgi:hypothetical protein